MLSIQFFVQKGEQIMTSFNWEKEVETQWDSRAHFWNERSRNMWDSGSRKDIVPFIKSISTKETEF
jgi:hypothetical protein